MSRISVALLVCSVFLSSGSLASRPAHAAGGDSCSNCCEQCGRACDAGALIFCEVMVSTPVAETRMEPQVVEKVEERIEKYTVFQLKPVTREFHKEYFYLEDEVKTKEIIKKKCHLIEVPVERTYVVLQPALEMRDVTECQSGVDKCGEPACFDETESREVLVEKKTTCPEYDTELRVAMETIGSELDYCVLTPKPHKELCFTEKTHELVPVVKERKVERCVPTIEKRPVTRMVYKMMPQPANLCPHCAAQCRLNGGLCSKK